MPAASFTNYSRFLCSSQAGAAAALRAAMQQLQAPYDYQAAARKSVFQRFDVTLEGFISVAALDSAFQSMHASLSHSHLGELAEAFPGARPGSVAYLELNHKLQELSPGATGRAAMATGGRLYDTAQAVPAVGDADVRVADGVRRLARRNANRSEGVLAALLSRYASAAPSGDVAAGGVLRLSPLGLTLPQFGLALREIFGVHLQPTELKTLHTAFDGDNDGHVRPEDFAARVSAVEQALLKGRQWGGGAATATEPLPAREPELPGMGSAHDGFLDALRSAGAGTKFAGVLSRNRGVVKSLFQGCDDNGNGSLSVDEFCRAMLVLGLASDDAQAARLARCFDSDGSGSIDFQELVDGFLAASGRCLEAARAALPKLQLDVVPAHEHAAASSAALVQLLCLVGRLSARQLVARHAQLAAGQAAGDSPRHAQAFEVFQDIAPYGARVFDFGSAVAALRTVAPECPPPGHSAAFSWFDPNGDGKVSYPAWVDSLFLLGATGLHAVSSAFGGHPPPHLTLEHHLSQLARMTPQQLQEEQQGAQAYIPQQQQQPPPYLPAPAWQPAPVPTQTWQPPARPDAFVLSSYLDITGVTDEIQTNSEMGAWTARRRTGRSSATQASGAVSSHTSGGAEPLPGFAPVPRPRQPPQLPPRHELANSLPVGGTETITADRMPGDHGKWLTATWGPTSSHAPQPPLAGLGASPASMGPWEHTFDLSRTMDTTLGAGVRDSAQLDTSALLRASWDSVAHGSEHAPVVAATPQGDTTELGRSLRWSNSARGRVAQEASAPAASGPPPVGQAAPPPPLRIHDGGATPQWGQPGSGLPPMSRGLYADGSFTPGWATPGWSTPVLPSGALASSMAGFPPASQPPPLAAALPTAAAPMHPLAIPAIQADDWERIQGGHTGTALLPSAVSLVGERTRQAVLHLRAQGPLMAAVQQAAAASGQGLPAAHMQQALARSGIVLDGHQMLAVALHVADACLGGVLGDDGQQQAALGGQQLRDALNQQGLHASGATVSPQQLHRWLHTPPIRKQASSTAEEPAAATAETPAGTPEATPKRSSTAAAEQRSLRRWTRQGDPAANAKSASRRRRAGTGASPAPAPRDAAGLALPPPLLKASKLAPGANAAALKLRRMFRKALVAEGNVAASGVGAAGAGGAARGKAAALDGAVQALQAADTRDGCSLADMAAALQGYGLPGQPPSEAALRSALQSIGALQGSKGSARVQVNTVCTFLLEGLLSGAPGQHLPATQRLSLLLGGDAGEVSPWGSSPRRDTAFADTVQSPAGGALGSAVGVGDLAVWHGREFWAQVDTIEHALSMEVRARASSISGARGNRVPTVTTTAAGLRSPPAKHATFELRDAFQFLAGSAVGALTLSGLHAALHRLGLLPAAPEPYPVAPTQAAATTDSAANVVGLAATPTAVALARAVFCRLLGHEDFHGNGMPKQARLRLAPDGSAGSLRSPCLYDRVVHFSTLARWTVPLNGRLQGVFDRLMRHLRHKAHRGAGVVDWSKAFASADMNGDGLMQRREFATMMRKLIPDIAADDVQALANAFDRDGNGSIDLEEFVAMMRQR